ncbi:MAG: hypothetical protein R3B38_00545 [Patescibacteria group bacterium]
MLLMAMPRHLHLQEVKQHSPKDEGEAQFTQTWLPVDEALEIRIKFNKKDKVKPMDNDNNQGKLYNLMTTYELLKQL